MINRRRRKSTFLLDIERKNYNPLQWYSKRNFFQFVYYFFVVDFEFVFLVYVLHVFVWDIQVKVLWSNRIYFDYLFIIGRWISSVECRWFTLNISLFLFDFFQHGFSIWKSFSCTDWCIHISNEGLIFWIWMRWRLERRMGEGFEVNLVQWNLISDLYERFVRILVDFDSEHIQLNRDIHFLKQIHGNYEETIDEITIFIQKNISLKFLCKYD